MKHKILITGGSSGIGFGIAQYFYKKGWDVLITGRNKDKLNAAKNAMPNINALEYSSLNEEHLDRVIDFIGEIWNGRLDILVNSAGHVELGSLKDITGSSMSEMYQVHLIGPSLLASKCLDFLAVTKGHILNITSSHGIKAYPGISAYGSAKAGLNMLTKVWALELAPMGINVNAIAPGPTNTDILKSAGFDDETISAIKESEKKQIPLQKRGSVADIVSAAVFLLDSGSEWTTGVVLPVDGGISIS
ncbi:SDR family NAD(P)-dependent oxidoreductase [Robertkochia solimangrovi]|uniref:SDR family NAD(P)-dependent oxidoreductase n=1 Tax=Robertkochia solimangrovi TaxID=2213046 RepID=UPI001180AA64|nr:SDR family oxidoreductase [Robertkochia solimangrovi]TRZ43117.1 ketoreductase [Robertkochia solimangrovi]